MGTNPSQWIDPEVETLTLANGNTIDGRPVDMVALVMSAENKAIPNQLLQQISNSFTGATPDRELICQGANELPIRGEPVQQGDVRGRVVDVIGLPDSFVVKVAMIGGTAFQPGPVRFGGIRNAMIERDQEAQWRPNLEELPQMGEFINLICRAWSVFPKLVNEVTDPQTQLLISRISQQDRLKIFNHAMPQEVRPAAMFPEGPAAGVAAAPDVQGIPAQSGG